MLHQGQTALARGKGRVGGFTLIEVVLILTLTGILSTVAVPQIVSLWNQGEKNSEDYTVSTIRNGIGLYQAESSVKQRTPPYPSNLDNGALGDAAPTNPFFGIVLSPPINKGWEKKTASLYQGPAGGLFAYNAQTGQFGPVNVAQADTEVSRYGNIIFESGDFIFYDSGVVVNRSSLLAYVPDFQNDTVLLTLLSGVQIQTGADGMATVLTADGEQIVVRDIEAANRAQFPITYSAISDDGMTYTGGALTIANGQANESKYEIDYQKKESSYDPATRTTTYDYEYTYTGGTSAGSLTTDYAMLYESEYESPSSQSSSGTFTQGTDGSYSGTTQYQYDYNTNTQYAYADPDSDYQYGFRQTGESAGGSETQFQYDAKTGDYQSTSSGSSAYTIDHQTAGGQRQYQEGYTYETTSQSNQKTGAYNNETRYRYQNGRDFTYINGYDPNTETVTQTVRDNKNGTEQTTRTKKPKKK